MGRTAQTYPFHSPCKTRVRGCLQKCGTRLLLCLQVLMKQWFSCPRQVWDKPGTNMGQVLAVISVTGPAVKLTSIFGNTLSHVGELKMSRETRDSSDL